MSGVIVMPESTIRLHQLASSLVSSADFAQIVKAVETGQPATIDGAVGSSCALAIAAMHRAALGQLVVVCASNAVVESLVDDLQLFGTDGILSFPAWETDPGQRLVYDGIYSERLRTLKSLARSSERHLIVCSIQSLLQPVPPPDAIAKNMLTLSVGDISEVDQVAKWLAERKFHAVSGVELPGEFARRGGLLDVYSGDWDNPARIEWFDNQIDSIRYFDVSTQRGVESTSSVEITVLPAAGNDPMRRRISPFNCSSICPTQRASSRSIRTIWNKRRTPI